jgi:small-conductance mechanosensitive channel
MTTNITPFKKGDRVTVSGRGRTAAWGQPAGTVTAVRYRSVFVQWDNLAVEDQMLAEELTKIPGEREETPARA